MTLLPLRNGERLFTPRAMLPLSIFFLFFHFLHSNKNITQCLLVFSTFPIIMKFYVSLFFYFSSFLFLLYCAPYTHSNEWEWVVFPNHHHHQQHQHPHERERERGREKEMEMRKRQENWKWRKIDIREWRDGKIIEIEEIRVR